MIQQCMRGAKLLKKKLQERPIEDLYILNRISVSLQKGTVAAQLRNLDVHLPSSWEFSAFSQNGEDGIIDFLTRKLINPDHFFVEIGGADGLQNNTSWLALARSYQGVSFEGNPITSQRAQHLYNLVQAQVTCVSHFITIENCASVLEKLLHYKNPDVVSLDIDGVDYFILQALLDAGFRPKIFAVEYNATFGPDQKCSVVYKQNFDFLQEHASGLYYGASITAFKQIFAQFGYQFVTVDVAGVNGFFVDPYSFDQTFLESIKPTEFRENRYQINRFKASWSEQFKLIEQMKFERI